MYLIQPFQQAVNTPNRQVKEAAHKVSPINEMVALKAMVKEISKSNSKIYNLNTLCTTYGVKRRGFYDFLSIGQVFNICQKHSNDNFEWFGFSNANSVLEKIKKEARNTVSVPIQAFFDCSLNSSIQNIAVSVVKLFFYLNQKTLDLRMIAKLFAQGSTKYKTMLRKLYTVAAGLELSEIIGKTNKVAEIRFLYPLQEVTTNPLDIMSMLNSRDDQILEELFQQRRNEFNELTFDQRYLAGELIFEPHIKQLVY